MQIGIAVSPGATSTPGSSALIDADFVRNRYGFAGRVYPTRAAFLAAVGGVMSGSALVLGPTLKGPELIPNGGFPTGDIDGWVSAAPFATYGSLAVSANQLVANINSPTGAYRAVRANAVTAGRAYRFAADVTAKSPTPSLIGLSINASASSELGGSDSRFADLGLAVPLHLEVTAGAVASALYTGFVTSTAVNAAASVTFDNFSLNEAVPYPGYAPSGLAFSLVATTPAVASGNKVALQWGTDGERFRVRLVWDASRHLRLIVTSENAEQANLDLGVVEPSVAFTLEASVGPNRVAARLDGGPSLLDNVATFPCTGRLWIGRSFTGEVWDGTLSRLAIWPGERLPDNLILAEGDSYVAGAGGVSLTASLSSALAGRAVVSGAVGGATPADIVSRLTAIPGLARGPVVIWDGDMNTGSLLADQLAAYASIVARIPHGRYLILPPCRRASKSGADNTTILQLQAALTSLYPGRVIDAQAILASHATSPGDNADITANTIPASLLQADLTHLTATGMGYLGAAVASEIGARGW